MGHAIFVTMTALAHGSQKYAPTAHTTHAAHDPNLAKAEVKLQSAIDNKKLLVLEPFFTDLACVVSDEALSTPLYCIVSR